MEYKNLKFMSIGSNCADLWYLGDHRIHGPLDNIVVKTAKCAIDAITGNLLSQIYTETPVIEDKCWKNMDDLKVILSYRNFKLVHNDPKNDKFKIEFTKRSDNLHTFINNILKNKENNQNWLVFNFNRFFVTTDHSPTDELIILTEKLRELNLLDKTIFIQLFRTDSTLEDKWESWLAEEEVEKLGIQTFNITNVLNGKQSQNQFKNQMIALLQKQNK